MFFSGVLAVIYICIYIQLTVSQLSVCDIEDFIIAKLSRFNKYVYIYIYIYILITNFTTLAA